MSLANKEKEKKMKKRKTLILCLVLITILSITMTACNEDSGYTITYMSNGGTAVAQFTGATLNTLPEPTKNGYIFDGWYEDWNFFGEAISVPYTIDKNTVLYAKWEVDSPEYNDGLKFTLLPDNTYSVSKGTTKDKKIFIPAKYNGLPVTKIGLRAFSSSEIEEVVMADTILEISNYAFADCGQLATVQLSSKLAKLGGKKISDKVT